MICTCILSYLILYTRVHMYVVTAQLGKLTSLGGGRKTTEANGNNKQWPSVNDYKVCIPTTDSTYAYSGHSIKDQVLHNMMGTRERVSLQLTRERVSLQLT